MNFAIGNTRAISWRRFKVGYLAAAVALPLAVAAAVGIAVARESSSGPSSPASVSQPASPAGLRASQTYVYVVGSQEEAIRLEMGIDESLTPNVFYEFLVVDTPEAEASFQLSQRELADAGLPGIPPGVTFVDTR
jgi:hypothetical protein